MIGSLGWQELLIILVILALIFGASRIADLGGALGKGIREFRSEARRSDEPKDDDKRQDGRPAEARPQAASRTSDQPTDSGDSSSPR